MKMRAMAGGLLVLGAVLAAGGAGPEGPRRVLYVGNAGTDRAREYEAFLKEHFARVGVADRGRFDPAQAEGFDVVLLDWSQHDANPDGKFEFPYPERGLKSPLGPRSGWSKPTVLLGSAGHLLAAAWQVHGGSG
jgi:hypothetical protein